MANRLATATSPYLLQHADNPVDWYEWGEEAFAEARRRDVPIFLSVGYSACHWCHVMAQESFEDGATAAQLNADFVSIKVDREERPDVDAVYMTATQAMTGQGGWPMSVMLTPDGQPFFAGTYFPPEPRHGMPAFRQILTAISEAWRDRRSEIEKSGNDITAHLQSIAGSAAEASTEFDAAAASAQAIERLRRSFDAENGGFGGAPKFPPSMILEYLLRRAARVGDAEALQMAESTLEAMARGGIYDQLGGGFARYSVDASWQVPHFEKMLYDNAQLLRVYVHWWRLGRSTLAERIARGTADFMIRELLTPQGGFASALDADSDGREGAFYVWSPRDLEDVLGEERGAVAADLFSVSETGNAEHGTSTLRLSTEPPDLSTYERIVRDLTMARERRPRPARDDKVVSAWNGMAVGALAEAGILLQESRYVDAAIGAARLLVEVHVEDGRTLQRASRDGVAGRPVGLLEDYACVAEGFLTLFAATGDPAWYRHARALVEQIESRFSNGEGGYFDTAEDAERLVVRPRDPTDNATPSGHAATAAVLVSMYGLTGDSDYRDRAESLLARSFTLMTREPRFAGKSLEVAEALADGPRQLAVIGSEADESRVQLVRSGFLLPYSGLVIAQGEAEASHSVPLLQNRGLVQGRSAAYLCHDFVCDLPVTDPALLAIRPTA